MGGIRIRSRVDTVTQRERIHSLSAEEHLLLSIASNREGIERGIRVSDPTGIGAPPLYNPVLLLLLISRAHLVTLTVDVDRPPYRERRERVSPSPSGCPDDLTTYAPRNLKNCREHVVE